MLTTTSSRKRNDMAQITKPIETPGILNTILGVGPRSDEFYYLKDLCTGPNINMWAKYKPVRYNTTFEIVDGQRAEVNYGLGIPYYLYNVFFDNSHDWQYLKPRGVSVNPPEWYRKLDFNGYNANAESPFIRLTMDAYVFKNKATNMSFSFYDADELPLASFKVPDTLSSGSPKSPLSQFTFCFLMKLGSDYYIWSTGVTPTTIVGQKTASVPVSISAMYPERTAAKIAVILCKDSTLIANQWRSVSSGQLTSYSIVPLGFTSSTIAEYSGDVRTFQSFTNPGAIVQVTHTPTTGQVYYGFTMVFSCTEINVGLPTAAYTFTGTMRVVRNGATVQSRVFVNENIVAQWNTGTQRYLFLFNNGGEVRATPLASQTGDEIWVDISYIGSGGSIELQTSTKVATI